MLLCCLDKKSTTCHMWISSCCSFGNKWAHLKHHWCSTPMCCCLALSLEGSLQVQKLRQERTSLSKAVDFLSKTQRFNKPTNRVNPPPSISCYHRNPLPSKDGPRPCFCWFHGRGSSQVEWPFGFDTHPPWSRQSTTVGLHCKKVKLWSQYGRSPLSARKFRKTLKSTLCKL